MMLHFASTGKGFLYPFYLAVLSAKKVLRPDKVLVWTTILPEDNKWWDLTTKIADICVVDTPNLPFIEEVDDWARPAVIADYLRFDKLYEYGGIYLDLDTFTLKDFSSFSDGVEVVVPLQQASGVWECNNHVILAKPKSDIIKTAREKVVERLDASFTRVHYFHRIKKPKVVGRHFKWAETGPRVLSEAVNSVDQSRVKKCPIEQFMYYSWENVSDFDENVHDIPDCIYLIHLFGSANTPLQSDILKNMTPEWIEKSNCVYANAVKRILTEKEWRV